ncbi:hypothetical protein [Nonomuraea sp. NPDC049646]|uniref:hypothetical protein n=1 Tax=unclassified Nonomuraea TaxID=2593643 RepID=UPI0037B42B30
MTHTDVHPAVTELLLTTGPRLPLRACGRALEACLSQAPGRVCYDVYEQGAVIARVAAVFDPDRGRAAFRVPATTVAPDGRLQPARLVDDLAQALTCVAHAQPGPEPVPCPAWCHGLTCTTGAPSLEAVTHSALVPWPEHLRPALRVNIVRTDTNHGPGEPRITMSLPARKAATGSVEIAALSVHDATLLIHALEPSAAHRDDLAAALSRALGLLNGEDFPT